MLVSTCSPEQVLCGVVVWCVLLWAPPHLVTLRPMFLPLNKELQDGLENQVEHNNHARNQAPAGHTGCRRVSVGMKHRHTATELFLHVHSLTAALPFLHCLRAHFIT